MTSATQLEITYSYAFLEGNLSPDEIHLNPKLMSQAKCAARVEFFDFCALEKIISCSSSSFIFTGGAGYCCLILIDTSRRLCLYYSSLVVNIWTLLLRSRPLLIFQSGRQTLVPTKSCFHFFCCAIDTSSGACHDTSSEFLRK